MLEIALQYLSNFFQSFSLGFDQVRNLFTSSVASTPNNIGAESLPSDIWFEIASFLQLEEQAIFLSSNSIKGASILLERDSLAERSKWESLDFGNLPLPKERNGIMEIDIASKITDNHMSAIFDTIDARNNVKTLYFTRCVTLRGGCLRDLRGSRVVEKIDLNCHQRGSFDKKETIIALNSVFSGRRKYQCWLWCHGHIDEMSRPMVHLPLHWASSDVSNLFDKYLDQHIYCPTHLFEE